MGVQVTLALFFATSAALVQLASTAFSLTSGAFANNRTIPQVYSYMGNGCTGHNLSPPLSWTSGPANTKSYALTVFDPDARPGVGWWHWVVFDIPANVMKLPAGSGAGSDALTPKGSIQGRNDFQIVGWGGPCPPPGSPPHHYVFTLYALDVAQLYGVSTLTSGPTLLKAMEGHILAKTTLIGRFGR